MGSNPNGITHRFVGYKCMGKENNQYRNNDNIEDLLSCFIAFFITIILKKYSILKGEKYLKEVYEKAKKVFEVISAKTIINTRLFTFHQKCFFKIYNLFSL